MSSKEKAPRLTQAKLKPPQAEVFQCDARFRVLVAGRRFGKTYLSLVELIRGAWGPGRLAWYVGPSYRQAKRIAWKPLKEMTREFWKTIPNETDLRIDLISGGSICVRGADRYDSLRGDGLDFLVLDECASIAKEAWPEVLRPALADKLGRALLTGTPRGHDHFHAMFETAQGREAETEKEWRAFQFTTAEGGNVRLSELASATRDMDSQTYRQEFEASFENTVAGRVYHALNRTENVGKVEYLQRLPLFWSLDFNVDPMCSLIGQRDGNRVDVLEEIVLRDSHTGAACEEFARRMMRYRRPLGVMPQIQIYGDVSGNGRRTPATRTDWQIVRDFLNTAGYGVTWHVGSVNPEVRDRINCVNALLCNQAGERRLTVSEACPGLVQDLERVRWSAAGGTTGGIDKSDPMRSHLSDALGYMVSKEFAMRPKGVFGQGRIV